MHVGFLFTQKSEWPDVTIGVFVEEPTPFLADFLALLWSLDYPKSKLTLLVHNNVPYHSEPISHFLTAAAKDEFKEVKYIAVEDDSTEQEARTEAM